MFTYHDSDWPTAHDFLEQMANSPAVNMHSDQKGLNIALEERAVEIITNRHRARVLGIRTANSK